MSGSAGAANGMGGSACGSPPGLWHLLGIGRQLGGGDGGGEGRGVVRACGVDSGSFFLNGGWVSDRWRLIAWLVSVKHLRIQGH